MEQSTQLPRVWETPLEQVRPPLAESGAGIVDAKDSPLVLITLLP